MATRTDGVGTPGDSIQSMKKFTPGELKKLDPKKLKYSLMVNICTRIHYQNCHTHHA